MADILEVEIVHVNHPSWRDSMRLFGPPLDSPCRLEQKGRFPSPWVKGSFRLKPLIMTTVGVPVYRLMDATIANYLNIDTSTKGIKSSSVDEAKKLNDILSQSVLDTMIQFFGWLLVPRMSNDGFDIVHFGTGFRLEVHNEHSMLQSNVHCCWIKATTWS